MGGTQPADHVAYSVEGFFRLDVLQGVVGAYVDQGDFRAQQQGAIVCEASHGLCSGT